MASRKAPGRFRSEAQEAEWWAKNQDYVAKRFEEAKVAGTLGRGSVSRLARQKVSAAGPSPTITIRIAENDLERARAPWRPRKDCATRPTSTATARSARSGRTEGKLKAG